MGCEGMGQLNWLRKSSDYQILKIVGHLIWVPEYNVGMILTILIDCPAL
jgi:hypothetical protein